MLTILLGIVSFFNWKGLNRYLNCDVTNSYLDYALDCLKPLQPNTWRGKIADSIS